jgi:tRNA A37 threonylcarbamoyladenosine synthetase subunit TsaC/SUA5/YrdC
MVGTRRGEQQSFGLRVPARLIALKQQLADGFGTATSAGLSGDENRDPAILKRFGQSLHLRGLADPFPAFEADEAPAP